MWSWVDNRALMVSQIILSLVLALALWTLHRVFPHLTGVRTIAAGFLVATVCRLAYVLGDGNRSFLLVLLGDCLAVTATVLFCLGLQQFLERPQLKRGAWISLACFCAVALSSRLVPRPLILYFQIFDCLVLAGARLKIVRELYPYRSKPLLRFFAIFMLLYVVQGLWLPLGHLSGLLKEGPGFQSLTSFNLLLSVTFSTALSIFFLALFGDALLREMERRSNTDPLTGHLNRRGFDQMLAIEITRSANSGNIFSIAIIDLDHFKAINDTYGHTAGDEALAFVACTMAANLRSHDLLGRRGGDEFAVLFPRSRGHEANMLAQRLCDVIAAARPSMTQHSLSLSIGIAEYEPTDTSSTLLSRADAALYQAKGRGRGHACFQRTAPPDQLTDGSGTPAALREGEASTP